MIEFQIMLQITRLRVMPSWVTKTRELTRLVPNPILEDLKIDEGSFQHVPTPTCLDRLSMWWWRCLCPCWRWPCEWIGCQPCGHVWNEGVKPGPMILVVVRSWTKPSALCSVLQTICMVWMYNMWYAHQGTCSPSASHIQLCKWMSWLVPSFMVC